MVAVPAADSWSGSVDPAQLRFDQARQRSCACCRDLVKPWHGTDKPSWMDAYGLLDQAPLQHVGSHSHERTHVLVCAPSNSALDEIVLRLTSDGVMDE